MKILVLSDKYPPYVQGGAEISLQLQVRALKNASLDIQVAAMCPEAPESWVHNGIHVHNLTPLSNHWPPYQHNLITPKLPLPAGLKHRFRWPETVVHYLINAENNGTLSPKARIHLFRQLSRQNAGHWLPSFDDDKLHASPVTEQLSDLIETFKPDILHADNHRSIMIASYIKPNRVELVSLIRDNRFFCPHQDQASNIAGIPCNSCKQECVNTDCPPLSSELKPLLKDAMQAVRDMRVKALLKSDKIIVTSQYLADQTRNLLSNKNPSIEDNISIVRNPCDNLEQITSFQTAIQKSNPPEILIVGMINTNKGQTQILQWLPKLKEKLPDFRIVIAGRGQLSEQITKGFAVAGLSDHLTLTGFLSREELYRAYARASVVVAPNKWPEPFGRTPLEAGLSKRPIVAFDVGGICESIIDGETGFKIPSQDHCSLVNRIVWLIQNPDIAKSIGENARAHILKNYNMDSSSKGLSRVWKK